MPRANIERHFVEQEDWGHELLKTPECKDAVKTIKRAVDARGRVPLQLLSSITGAPSTSLAELKPARDRGTCGIRLPNALKALREYLPRVLHWKSLVTLSKELGLHRNQVEKLARDGKSSRLLMYARDKRLYISPEGEKFVRKRFEQLEQFGERPTPSEVASAHKVPLNLLTSYFSSRGVAFEKDPLGRARLTLEQVVAFAQWRKDVAQRAELPPIMIDGEWYEAVKIAVRRRAERIFLPNTPVFDRYAKSCEASLKHFAKKGRILKRTKNGAYIPSTIAKEYAERVSVPEGARLIGVAASTIKAWRKAHKGLTPSPLPGRYCLDVALDPLLTFAARRYLEEPKLKMREKVPSILVDHALDLLAQRADLDKRGLVLNLPIPKSAQEKILARSSTLRRSDFEIVICELDRVQHHLTNQCELEGDLIRSPGIQAQKLGPNLQILPSWKVLQLVEEVAMVRECTPDLVYSTMREYFSLPSTWPTTFSHLGVLHRNGMPVHAYPLKVGGSLESLLRSYRERPKRALVS